MAERAFNLDTLRPLTQDSHMLPSTTPSTEKDSSLTVVPTLERAFTLDTAVPE